jgi:chromosome segregation ATPase
MFKVTLQAIKARAIRALQPKEDTALADLREQIEALQHDLENLESELYEVREESSNAKDTAENVEYKLDYEYDLDNVATAARNSEEHEERLEAVESRLEDVVSTLNDISID